MVAVKRTLPAPPELQGRWAALLEEAGLRPQILGLADRFPENRSLEVPFSVIDAVDTGLADLLLERPEEVIDAGRRAMRDLLPVAGPEADSLRLRPTGLPPTAHRTVRAIREADLNHFIAIDGIVRRVTEVRPQIRDAVFACVACRIEFHEPQDDASMVFREPLECPDSQGGCGRPAGRTRFRLLPEKSTYVDAQRIEIQENPESLRRGAHPQGLTTLLTEDLAGHVLPGNRVILNGVVKSYQRATAARGGALRNTTFDLLLQGVSVESQQVEYDEIEISPEEEKLILSYRDDPTVVDKIVLSLAPTIKGMEQEKEAIALQMFGGIEKRHSDGIRVRGDIHTLLVGDPGCLIGDERVALGDGTMIKLARMGSAHHQPLATRVRLGTGSGRTAVATRFHRYRDQPILEVVTESGKCIKGTPNHPLLRRTADPHESGWTRLDRLEVGDRIAVATGIRCRKQACVPTGWREPRTSRFGGILRVPPLVDEHVAAILGYVLGGGTVTSRRVELLPTDPEEDVLREIGALFERVFGVSLAPEDPTSVVPLRVDRAVIAEWLRGLRTLRIPEPIFGSPDRVVASFLRWLFEAKGTCAAAGDGDPAVSLRSPRIEALRDVQTLLLRWGIQSHLGGRTTPRLRGKDGRTDAGDDPGELVIDRASSVDRFARHVAFVSRTKNEALATVRRKAQGGPPRVPSGSWERVVSVRRAGRATVYDIEVPGPQRFLANGVVSHNTAKSQLLRYVADVAPRAIYTSGKGATAAGLTAAAVKDDFAGGRWVLEAGMLVLADGGMAVIDELDKMSPEDRSAMHEALEQGSVSIAKAGITSTLNARCPVLAAANPKWGRFSPDRTISEQIDLPPTLLSRFDVIFSIQDHPNQERDRRLANRILASHREGEVAGPGGIGVSAEVAPFQPDLLKKYIAYARRTVHPILSDAALAALEDFYVRVRRQGEEPNAPVPITARQLEALVRLSEAAARARLSPVVGAEDARRAIQIMENYLRRVSTAEDGRLDIDLTQTGISHSQRERHDIVMRVMRELQEQGGGTFTHAAYLEAAAKAGVESPKAEALLVSLRNQGEVIEPRPNQLQLVRF